MWLAWDVVPAPEPLGALTVGVTEAGVAAVCFGSGAVARRQLSEAARRLGVEPCRGDPRAATAIAELADYLAGRRRVFDQPIDWRLTDGDQRTVLRTLHRHIGYGQTTTYGELAVRSGAYRPEHHGTAARRVGSIMGSNPVPVVVPCHRVLAANGLGGFGPGLEAKRWLLGLEGAMPPMLDLDWD